MSPVLAQEEKYIDGQPQDIYNATTTLFTTQENIQYNQKDYQTVAEDINISGMHRFTFVQQHGNKLQNLGNNGTASKPIFYTIPENIGITSGFHAYDIYFRSPSQFRYYNTKSPYSKMYVMLARFGSFYADLCHSRNVTPYWNIGVNFRNMMTDKEWIPSEQGDRNVIAYGLDLFTHYKTENEKYQLLAHYLIAKHRVRETGGIYTPKYDKSGQEEALWKHSMQNRLQGELGKNPESSDARGRLHVYHQLALAEPLWAYHELGVQEKKYRFQAESLTESIRMSLGGKDTDQQETITSTTTAWEAHNELGIKGNWQDWFYCGYYRHKKIEYTLPKGSNNLALHEHYIGLQTRCQLADNTQTLHLAGEYLLQEFYKARVAYEAPHWDVACVYTRHKPSLLAQYYQGYYRHWDESFAPPKAVQVSGGLRIADNNNRVRLRPYISLTRVDNHVYFDHKLGQRHAMIAEPKQSREHANIITLGTDLGLTLGRHIRWDSELTTASVKGPSASVFNIPTFSINSRLYYANATNAGNGAFETGIDVHWKSSYKADAYDPVTQQFYRQNEFTAYSYPIIDLFLNFRIKNFSAFLKFSHCNEFWLVPAPGYFVTPFYPGQKKALDIGINWSFFD